jgi:hypothetical protein
MVKSEKLNYLWIAFEGLFGWLLAHTQIVTQKRCGDQQNNQGHIGLQKMMID